MKMTKQNLKKFVQILESNVHTKPRINTKDVVNVLKSYLGEEALSPKNRLLKLKFDPSVKLLKLVALTIILRDEMEDMDFPADVLEASDNFIEKLNNSAEHIASGGEKSNEQLMKIVMKTGEALDRVFGL